MATNCLDIMELGLSECGDWERAAKVDGGCFRTTMDVDVEGFLMISARSLLSSTFPRERLLL